jgi:hypothetical protein
MGPSMAWVNIRGRLLVGSSEDDDLGRALLPAAITIDVATDELICLSSTGSRIERDADRPSGDPRARTVDRRSRDDRHTD